MAGGALLMVPAALFIIASGITLLQVAANPHVTVIGPPETASSRLNLVQAFDSLGTTLAPLFAGYLILGRSKSGTAAAGVTLTAPERYSDAQSVILPYVLVAIVLAVLAIVIARFPLPAIGQAAQRASQADRAGLSLWNHRNLVFGIPAIFICLIAEIGVANLFIIFVSQPEIADITPEQASRYLALLWGGMMVGRFVGGVAMRRVPAERVLAGFGIAAFAVMIVATFAHGPAAMWALILVGLCHSIMFSTIFSLGIRGLGPLTEEGSGLLIMAIAGGSLVVVQGWLADRFGLQWSFLLTTACELYILFHAVRGSRVTHALPDERPIPQG